MPGHIFDTNTFRNFALVGELHLLRQACPGRLYIAQTVKAELLRGPKAFVRRHRHRLADPRWMTYADRFKAVASSLRSEGFHLLKVTASEAHAEMAVFLACLLDEDLMEEGEAESFALAVYSDLSLYSDEWKVNQLTTAFNAARFPCPWPGEPPPPSRELVVHSTAWILLQAVEAAAVAADRAEEIYLEMQDIWPRHPGLTLEELRSGQGAYW